MKSKLNNAFAVLALVLMTQAASSAAEENPVFNKLLNEGVPLANGKTVKLPKPVMADGLDAAAQKKILEQLAPNGRVKDFVRGSVSDPFALKITDERGTASKSVGRKVDLYFVARGELETVASKDFMKQQVERGENEDRGKAEYFTKEELAERKLTTKDTDRLKERYAHAVIPLFGMVQASGSGHAIQTRTDESVTVAFNLDPRFANDPKYPNQWRPITKDDQGNRTIGDPEPYAGAGAYVKVTALKDPAGSVFVEYHLVFDEPYGWWAGKAVLSSKLPEQYRVDVRNFRRNLAEFGTKQAK